MTNFEGSPTLWGTNPATGLPLHNGLDSMGNAYGSGWVTPIASDDALTGTDAPVTGKVSAGVRVYQLSLLAVLAGLIANQALG